MSPLGCTGAGCDTSRGSGCNTSTNIASRFDITLHCLKSCAGNYATTLQDLKKEAATYGITDLPSTLVAVDNVAVQAAPALSLAVSLRGHGATLVT